MVSVVHVSKTPLAGAPIRLVHALQQHTEFNARLIDLERWNVFDHDIVHNENPELSLELIKNADIIHLHNYLGLESEDFSPIDFNALRNRGVLFVRQFHTHPDYVAKRMGIATSALLSSPVPSLVIAQFQERFYPQARVVPNIIPHAAPHYLPQVGEQEHGIFFSPSNTRGAWQDRWNTKAAPETLAIMRQTKRLTNCSFKVVTNQPHTTVMEEKRKAALVIDDLVTGSYHLSGIEGLSVGRPVLCFLDERTRYVISVIAGTNITPFINTRLEDALEVLVYLLRHSDEADDIGRENRTWIEKHWSDFGLVQHYSDVYRTLLSNSQQVVRQEALSLDQSWARFYSIALPDAIHEARQNSSLVGNSTVRLIHALRRSAFDSMRRITHVAARYLPDAVKSALRKGRNQNSSSLRKRRTQLL